MPILSHPPPLYKGTIVHSLFWHWQAPSSNEEYIEKVRSEYSRRMAEGGGRNCGKGYSGGCGCWLPPFQLWQDRFLQVTHYPFCLHSDILYNLGGERSYVPPQFLPVDP